MEIAEMWMNKVCVWPNFREFVKLRSGSIRVYLKTQFWKTWEFQECMEKTLMIFPLKIRKFSDGLEAIDAVIAYTIYFLQATKKYHSKKRVFLPNY